MSAKTIYVVSDSTGATAERVVRAVLQQFPDHQVRVKVVRRVRDEESLRDVLKRVRDDGAMVVFTFVLTEVRQIFSRVAAEYEVEGVDVIGSLIQRVGAFLAATPLNIPTAEMPLSEEYFRRVEAIEFAVQHDDGKSPHNLKHADIVLVGVSRTSKTPLSTYLAGRGLKVANMPLVPGVDPPAELNAVPGHKVVGLTIDVDLLLEIRRQRMQQLGMGSDADYGEREAIRAELDHAHKIYRQHPDWLIVNVTNCAIEETAAIILEAMKARWNGNSIPPPAPS